MQESGRNIRIAASTLCMILFITLSITQVFSQHDTYAERQPEKIYLQLDASVYTTDQTIWYKAIVTDNDQLPTSHSGVLHVELISPDGQLLKSQLLKLEDGIGTGAIPLIENEIVGRYLIRAYTEWNRNFGPDHQFLEYINVFSSSPRIVEDAISGIHIIEKGEGKSLVQARLKPLVIDSLHEGTLTVHLTIDNKGDSLTIRKNSAGDYAMEYILPANARLGTISIVTKNSERSTKTFAIDELDIDLQFFPEGGELVQGLISKIGFKALDFAGNGRQVEGDIINERGKVITSFKSNEHGMGYFFMKGDTGVNYYAQMKPDGLNPVKRYRLPDASPTGSVFMIRRMDGVFRVTVSSNDQKTDSVYLRLTCRDKEYDFIRDKLKNGGLIIDVSHAELPEGILVMTLLDKNRQPRAERLVFNEKPENRLLLELKAQEVYHQRDKATVNMSVIGSTGLGVASDVSVLVINKEQLGTSQTTRENILSSILLSSELRGEIEDPGYYFRKENKDRLDDLDALLLTQGWSRYLYNKLPDSFPFQSEYNLQISGSVGGLFFKDNKKEGVELTLMTFGQDKMIAAQITDSLGRFHFDVHDTYGEKLNFVIQSKNEKDRNKDYSITVNKRKPPEILYQQGVEYANVIDSLLIEKNRERKATEEAFRIGGVNYLNEVDIKALRYIPERDKLEAEYGKADVVIDGKEIQEKGGKWEYGLYSVIMNSYPKVLGVRRIGGPGGFLYAQVYKKDILGGPYPTIVVIDGIPVSRLQYPQIPNIPPGEVKSFDLILAAKNFYQIFRQAFPEVPPAGAPVNGAIIAIYTVAGKGITGIENATGIAQMSIPAFTPPREFYAPKYEKLTPEDWNKPDLRGLIHWQPQIKTNNTGDAEVSFYNADVTGDMLVVVEAIAADGRIGYQELVYKVKKRE